MPRLMPYVSNPDAEPTYNAGTQTLVLSETFDSYTTFADAIAGGWRGLNGGTAQDTTTNAGGANLIDTPGLNGTGRAVRLRYDGISNGDGQEAHSWHYDLTDILIGNFAHPAYFSMDFKIDTKGATMDALSPNENLVKVKWLEMWGKPALISNRMQVDTTYQTKFNMPAICVNHDGSGSFFSVYGNGGGNTFYQGTQLRGPYLKDHANTKQRFTVKYRQNSAPGALDGCIKAWLDGTLVVAVDMAHASVVVPGNDAETEAYPPYWCLAEDVDQIMSEVGIGFITLGSVQTAALWPFELVYDNVQLWRD